MDNSPPAARVLLAVDLSYQSYRASAAHPMLTSGRHFTGGLYGFFQTMAKAIRETKANRIIICKDTKPYLRSAEYPEYKMLRKGNANEELLKMHKASMRLIEEVLVTIGAPIWSLPGFESDDLIGHLVRVRRHRYQSIYAASNDSDLFQLFDARNFFVYSKDIESLWHRERLWSEFGVTPDEYLTMTALTGTHNDIAGIHKVGPKTAVKAIKDPSLMRTYMEKHGDLISRNKRLIHLPHREFPRHPRIPGAAAAYDSRVLYRALGRYDIDVTATISRSFEQVLTYDR